jgi:multiple sugar transport system substrate-binding protein
MTPRATPGPTEPAGRDGAVGVPGRPEPGASERTIARRTVVRGLAGVAGLAAVPSLLTACGSGTTTSPVLPTAQASAPRASSPEPSPIPGSGIQAAGLTVATYFPETDQVVSRFTAESGIDVKLRTVDAASFSDTMDPYLRGRPEDVISWGAGRANLAAVGGLLTPLDDVWAHVRSKFPAAVQAFVTAPDGHRYQMPVQAYAFAVFYRKSVFAAHGYSTPTTWSDYKALAARMQRDGLIPIAMGDSELYEALGTFDILDLRLNGCEFHLDLLAGKEKWTDPRVKAVFERWLEIIPFTQTGATGRSQDDAAKTLLEKRAGMYLMGTGIMLPSIPASDLGDIDVFPFPAMGTPWDAEQSFDMPVDGFAIPRNAPTLPRDLDNAKAFIEFLSKGSTALIFASSSSGNVAVTTDADTSGYNGVQRKVLAMIGAAKRVAEYFDRDTDPGFAFKAKTAMQDFLAHPDTDLAVFLATLQGLWDDR